MLEKTKPHDDTSLAKWMGLNAIGWSVGVFATMMLASLYYEFDTAIYNFSPLLDSLITFAVSLPLGFAVGVSQSFQLKLWNIKTSSWLYATTFGWWVPATLFFFYFESDYYNPSPWGPLIPLIIIGASLGACQVLVIRKVFSRSGLWILSNAIGICAFSYLVSYLFPGDMTDVPFLIKRLIYRLFDDPDQLIYLYSIYNEIFGVFFLPLFGVLMIALPTGVLLKFLINRESINALKSKASIAG